MLAQHILKQPKPHNLGITHLIQLRIPKVPRLNGKVVLENISFQLISLNVFHLELPLLNNQVNIENQVIKSTLLDILEILNAPNFL